MQDKFAFEINANGAFTNEQKAEDELEFVSLPQLSSYIVGTKVIPKDAKIQSYQTNINDLLLWLFHKHF